MALNETGTVTFLALRAAVELIHLDAAVEEELLADASLLEEQIGRIDLVSLGKALKARRSKPSTPQRNGQRLQSHAVRPPRPN